MVIKVEYHMEREYFIKHKKSFQKILSAYMFEISILKFEKQVTDKEIARKHNLSIHFARTILSNICCEIRKNGFVV